MKSSQDEYIPVPIIRAEEISRDCQKEIVIILTADTKFNQFGICTFGSEPYLKVLAARLGQVVARAAGADLQQTVVHEKVQEDLDLRTHQG